MEPLRPLRPIDLPPTMARSRWRPTTGEGEGLASVGQGEPFAPALIEIDDNGEVAASLTVSVSSSQDYIDEVERLTGREAAVYSDGQTQVELEDGESVEIPASGGADVTADGREWRVLTGELPGGEGQRIALFGPPAEAGFFESSPTVIAVLAAVLGIALLMVWYLRRHLSRQVAVMLAAAKRIGAGDFTEDVPVIGGRLTLGRAYPSSDPEKLHPAYFHLCRLHKQKPAPRGTL